MITGPVLNIVLGVVLFASALPKLRHIRGFAVRLLAYEVVPVRVGRALARVFPVAEVVVGLLLMTGALSRLADIAAGLLFATFAIGIGVNLSRGRTIDCGCFGTRGRKIGKEVLAEDLALIAAASLACVAQRDWLYPARWSPLVALHLNPVEDAGLCVGSGLIIALVLGTIGSKERSLTSNRRFSAVRE